MTSNNNVDDEMPDDVYFEAQLEIGRTTSDNGRCEEECEEDNSIKIDEEEKDYE